MHTILGDPSQFTQAVDLESSRIRENGAVPVHEVVKVAVPAYHARARAQPQVEGIAENDLRAEIAQFLRGHRFDSAVGAHRHEGRRLHSAPREAEPAPPGKSIFLIFNEFHRAGPRKGNLTLTYY